MPVHVCPRCQRTNPEAAAYCYYDGALLQAEGTGNGKSHGGGVQPRVCFSLRRRCHKFRRVLPGVPGGMARRARSVARGIFKQFFSIMGRADLVRASQEAMEHVDGDMG